jgi:adenylate cyclase class 1
MSGGFDSKLKSEMLRHVDSYLHYNKSKLSHALELCSESQKAAYHLVPYFLHAHCSEWLGQEGRAPSGIHGYYPLAGTQGYIHKYFGLQREMAVRNTDAVPPIEFLSLMGSVGTIAFSTSSDFDYWVCLKEEVSEAEMEDLDHKLRSIEKWCEIQLGVEVHFFTMKSSRLVANDFGSVSKESCGSAQAKLLKEEYFRASLLVAGKLPYWWITPYHLSNQDTHEVIQSLENDQMDLGQDFVHIGSCSDIPDAEFLGAGLWQLNKGILSPYKSLLKLALIMTYRAERERGWISDDFRMRVQTQFGKVGDYDPYLEMMKRVLNHFERRKEEKLERSDEDLETLKMCFYIKIGVSLSTYLSAKRLPDNFQYTELLSLISDWGWDRHFVANLEHVETMSAKKTLALKARLESFMLRGLKDLFDCVGGERLREVMSEEDESKLLNRLLTVYDRDRDRVEWFYPPFDVCLISNEYSIVRGEDGSFCLYKGRVNLSHITQSDERFLLNVEPSFLQMGMWMIYNKLLENNPTIHSNLPEAKVLNQNFYNLYPLYRNLFGQQRIPSLDGSFAEDPKCKKLIFAIQITPTEKGLEGLNTFAANVENYSDIFDVHRQGAFRRRPQERRGQAPQQRIDRILKGLMMTDDDFSDSTYLEQEPETSVTKLEDVQENEAPTSPVLGPKDDVFNAWDTEVNLCRSACLIEKNSWGEVVITTGGREGGSSFLSSLVTLVEKLYFEGLSLELDLGLFIGQMPFDTKRIRSRFLGLVRQMLDFFRDKDPRPKFFFSKLEGEITVFHLDRDQLRYRFYESLSQATLDININFMESIRLAFDDHYGPWEFYRTAYQEWEHARYAGEKLLHLSLHKGTKSCYYMLVDPKGHCAISTMGRDEIKYHLPRLLQSIESLSKKEGELALYWFNRKDGRAFMEAVPMDRQQKIRSTLSKRDPLELVMPWSSALSFLKKYVVNLKYVLENDVVKNEVRYVLSEVKRLRGHQSESYRIYLSEIPLIGVKDDDKSLNLVLLFYLKFHLERVCTMTMKKT